MIRNLAWKTSGNIAIIYISLSIVTRKASKTSNIFKKVFVKILLLLFLKCASHKGINQALNYLNYDL